MTKTATLAAGCFWCTEAIFKRLKGVEKVTSGYAGGNRKDPTYEAVTTGATGHAEAIQIEFNPEVMPYAKLLEVFFKLHDPTTRNRQGADVGTQYRSVIFYHDNEQKKTAEEVKNSIEKSGYYKSPIVTEVVPFQNFYPAEEYHQNFYAKNPSAGYCQVIIDPKIHKLLDEFKNYLKE